MKTFLIVTLLLCSTFSFGQIQNFKLENNQVKWEKVFTTDKSFEEIFILIKGNSQFSDIVKNESSIQFSVNDYSIDYKGAGGSLLGTKSYITNSKYSGKVILEYKPSKYRIVLTHLMFLYSSMDLNFGRNQTTYSLEETVVKNNDFRKVFINDAPIFNYSFNKLFDFSQYKVSSDEW